MLVRRSFQGSSLLSVAATEGILKLGFFIAEHNVPVATADHLITLIRSIAPDSKIVQEITGARTKMTAAIHTVADASRAGIFDEE